MVGRHGRRAARTRRRPGAPRDHAGLAGPGTLDYTSQPEPALVSQESKP